MKRTFTSTLSLLLCLVMLLGVVFTGCDEEENTDTPSDQTGNVLGADVDGDNTTDGDDNTTVNVDELLADFIYKKTETGYEIAGVKDKSKTTYVIPDIVTSIGSDAFSWCQSLTGVTIGDGVTSIGKGAFLGCSKLTSITIPDSVETVGSDVFYGCIALASITIPDSVEIIGGGAFDYCTNLQYNEYDNAHYLGNESNPYVVLIEAKSTDITSCDIHSDTKFIYGSAFFWCSSLTSITIPVGVTSIGDWAFSGCSGLTSATIPVGVTSIGEYAFYNCRSLTSVTIPDGVTSIGEFAFYNCRSLASVTIPDSVTGIGQCVFSGCSGLTSITFEDTSTWYRTTDSSYTNGSSVSVDSPTGNVEYFTSTYWNYYWYKK